jgi:hypothetical protein
MVDADPDAQTAFLLPSDGGEILDKVAWATLKFYHGREVN